MAAQPPASPSPREFFERWHDQWLAAAAVREAGSGGRQFAQGEHLYRTCFQRDRDRIIHSTAFRRLDFKTQVFVPHEQDHFRTRMTHTLEVAQIARSLGRALRFNEDLIEAAALAHDLGHPPFGHCGEAVLDDLMADHGRFEHNRQSLRVVDYLEHPYPHFRGLNLTPCVRECIARHRSRYDAALPTEFPAGLEPPLEGQLVDLADEIAYTSADLEDALAAGWIAVSQLSDLSLWRLAWAVAQADAPDSRDIHKRIRACKAVLAIMTDDAIAATSARLAASPCRSPDDVRRAGRALAGFSDDLAGQVRQMQDFLMDHVYRSAAAREKEVSTRRVITGLFAAFRNRPELLPQRYRQRIEDQGLHRVICDYIAGMTDRFCQQQYEQLVVMAG